MILPLLLRILLLLTPTMGRPTRATIMGRLLVNTRTTTPMILLLLLRILLRRTTTMGRPTRATIVGRLLVNTRTTTSGASPPRGKAMKVGRRREIPTTKTTTMTTRATTIKKKIPTTNTTAMTTRATKIRKEIPTTKTTAMTTRATTMRKESPTTKTTAMTTRSRIAMSPIREIDAVVDVKIKPTA